MNPVIVLMETLPKDFAIIWHDGISERIWCVIPDMREYVISDIQNDIFYGLNATLIRVEWWGGE